MSEEESFVILGSSPVPSLCSRGNSLLHDALEHDGDTVQEKSKANETFAVASATLIQQSNIPDLTKEEQRPESSLPATLPSEQNSLAASFIMGDVTPEVLKVCMQSI